MPIFQNHTFYKKALKEYGVSAQGVHWSSKYTQYKRFEVLTQFIQKELDACSIVDVGCGFGEYVKYLKEFYCLPQTYIGIDCEAFMIETCQRRFPSLQFLCKDVFKNELPIADYYVCSGAMNILNQKEFFQFLQRCFESSLKGIVFNFLTKDSFNDIQKEEILTYCQKLPCTINIQEGYLYNDMSLHLIKNR
jgi:SAM-dependent methyltransferase